MQKTKESTPKKKLQLINEYGKEAGYNKTTHKSQLFLYTNNEQS